MSRLLLVTSSAAFEERVRSATDLGPGDVDRLWRDDLKGQAPQQTAHEIIGLEPGVVCLGPSDDVDFALQVAAALDEAHPELVVVLVAQPGGDLWQRALQAGVRDVISPAVGDQELGEHLDRALETVDRRRANLVGSDEPTGGRVIVALSPKGGSGKTVVASNLAIGLAQQAPDQVCIVDLDMQFGDLGSALQIIPEYTIADVGRAGPGLDVTTVKVFLTPHPSKCYVLAGSQDPADADRIKPDTVGEVLRLLANEFRFVVVDTSAGLGEHTLMAIDEASDLILVCSMDVPSVRGLRKEVAALDAMKIHGPRRHFVLNRADSRVGLDVDDVVATVGMPVDVEIPSSRSVPLALNQGTPLIESDPRSPVARQFQRLVERFVEVPEGEGGLFRLRRKR